MNSDHEEAVLLATGWRPSSAPDVWICPHGGHGFRFVVAVTVQQIIAAAITSARRECVERMWRMVAATTTREALDRWHEDPGALVADIEKALMETTPHA
jgi:hypothetical protein